MAQPVFDGHPLEEYFLDSGDASEPMPGGIADFVQPCITGPYPVFKHAERMERLCFLFFGAVESLCSCFSSHHTSLRAQAFAERFKYGVISSSLLSPAFPATPIPEHKRALTPSLPGRLNHSRTTSAAESTLSDTLSLSMPPEPETPIWPLTLSFTVAVAAFSARFYFVALSLLVATLYYMHVHKLDIHTRPDVMTPSLLALQHLIAAGRLWDSVINDTFTMLESEEQSLFGPTSPRTPSSPLRVALSTSLLTTQTQCDHVRQLLSAITSPSELSQLAEMYAPPSPIKPTFTRSSDSHRPLSHPGSPRGTPTTDRTRKRSTWNGSYTSLAHAGTSPALAQRREKRRSDLSALLGSPCPPRTRNAPSPLQLLADVSEEEEEEGMVTAASSVVGDEDKPFGATALGLYRTRVREGLCALERARPPSTLPGKYTRLDTARHPLSVSALRRALQGALASKRFACAHLLALRFEEGEEEGYWEDARAVMGLLTTTLVDASARLSEVLEEAETREVEGPSEMGSPPRRVQASLSSALASVFAPTPSHWARFAAHVDAMEGAIKDAREALGRCVEALGEGTGRSRGHSSQPSTSSGVSRFSAGEVGGTGTGHAVGTGSASAEPPIHPAIQAYDQLRRELGLALRECERGRERLLYVVTPPTPATSEELEVEPEAEAEPEPMEESEREREVEPPTEHATDGDAVIVTLPPSPPLPEVDLDSETAPQFPGIEHVFEADTTSVPASIRERPRLSRDERIRLARAKRASSPPPPPDCDRWGPSGDVVQELKDVIWKVGERRRKLAEGA